MRSILFVVMAIFIGSISFAKNPQGMSSETLKSLQLKQDEFRKIYDEQKTLRKKNPDRVLFSSDQKRIHLPKEQEEKGVNLTKQIAKANYSFKSWYREVSKFIRYEVARWSSNLKHWSLLALEKVTSSKVEGRSIPPVVPAIDQPRIVGGARPVVLLRTTTPIVDPDGTVDTITWDYGDGTAQVFKASDLDAYGTVEHIFPRPAHYSVTLTVKDNTGDITSTYIYVEPLSVIMPDGRFTASQNVGPTGIEINFDVVENAEWEGTTYHWDFGNGATAYGPSASYQYLVPGIYNVRMTAVSDQLGVSESYLQVFIGTAPPTWGSNPVPILETTERVGRAPFKVTFDASKSYDIDGTISSYKWDFGDSTTFFEQSGSVVEFTYNRPGTYYGKLLVRDAAGGESEKYFRIIAESEQYVAPDLIALQWGDSRTIDFDFSVFSLKSAALENKYYWDFGDGNSHVGSWASHTYTSNGTYTASVGVKDIFGNTFSTSKDITVTEVKDMPEPALRVRPRRTTAFATVTFDASDSYDPGQSEPLIYKIEMGDGTQYSDPTGSYAYDQEGFYRVEAVVTNSRGLSSWVASSQVSVQNGFSRPYSIPRYSPKVGNIPLTVNLDGTGSYASGGTIEKYHWRKNDTSLANTALATDVLTEPGSHWYELYVKDNNGNVEVQSREVVAVDPLNIPPGNSPPVATFSVTPDPEHPTYFEFDASGTTDPDDDYIVYEWRVNGELMEESDYFDYNFPEKNIYDVTLTAYDQWGASSTFTQTINLSSFVGQRLVLDFAPIKPIAGQSVRFGAEGSLIPGSTIVSYSWDFGDSSFGTGVSTNHTYSSAGTYAVTLSVTDSNSHTFTTTKNIIVEAVNSNPTLRLTARDIDLITEVEGGGIYKGTSMPETVYLSVRSTSNSNKFIKDAVWDFGDGQTGFGADVEYTYTKPGTYTVSVTGYDANNLSGAASLTVVIPADCKRLEGETECLNIPAISNNILPFTADHWVISRVGNFATDTKYFPKGWLHLKALDGSDDLVDLSTAATVLNNTVSIEKQKLVDRNIDFKRPYKLVLDAKDSAGSPVLSEIPVVYFGAAQMRITTTEQNVRLVITNPSAQFKKFINMGASTEVSLSDLPLGPTTIIAEKGANKEFTHVRLQYNKIEIVPIDLQLLRKKRERLEKNPSKLTRKNLFKEFGKREQWAGGNKIQTSQIPNWPAWSMGLCGEAPPFGETKAREISSNQKSIWTFDSWNPTEQSVPRDVPVVVGRPVRLSCAISSESLMYGFVRWKYKDGPQRCWQDPKAHWYWDWYLKNMKYEDDAVTISYEVQDAWTGESYKDYLITSARAMRQKMGRELSDVTQRIGVLIGENKDWSYRQNYDLYIPPHFKRPKISFSMQSLSSSVKDDFYGVNCDVVSMEEAQPGVTSLKATGFNDSLDRASRNGQYSLQNRYKYFPIHFDDRSTSAYAVDADVSKAQYEVAIRFFNQSMITWTGVDVEFSYNGAQHTESYSFDGTPVIDSEAGVYKNTFTIDTAILAGKFSWSAGADRMQIKVTPKGEDEFSAPVTGRALTQQFIPLFDIQNIESAQNISLCSNGYYSTYFSMFVQEGMVRSLKNLSDAGIGVRCGTASLPFGGPMDVTNLIQDTYRHGQAVKIRTFNESDSAQDNYDSSLASLRLQDIIDYKDFSATALAISQVMDEEIGGLPTDKKKLFDFCKPSGLAPKYPCDDNTQFADLDHDMVLKICQWYSVGGVEVEGCPTGYLPQVRRFSQWVKKNAADLSAAQNLLLQPTLSSGRHLNSDYQDVQRMALVYGIWPDGKPIWDVSTAGTELTNKRVMSCHEKAQGCEHLRSAFKNDRYYVDAVEIINGWRP